MTGEHLTAQHEYIQQKTQDILLMLFYQLLYIRPHAETLTTLKMQLKFPCVNKPTIIPYDCSVLNLFTIYHHSAVPEYCLENLSPY